MSETILSLDLSSKCGWAVLLSEDRDFSLLAYGQIPKSSEPIEPYPGSYVTWAYQVFGKINELIEKYTPDVLVIEETAGGSKSAYSQKILEFIHFLIARFIKETGIKSVYYQTETWRRIVGCVMNTAEKDNNKELRALKKKNPDIELVTDKNGKSRKKAKRFKNKDGKSVTKIGRKHVNVRRANELLGKFLKKPLIMQDEDTADALLLATAYHMKKVSNE